MQKCKGMRERDNSRTTPTIHRKEVHKKKGGGGGGEHSFPFANSVKIEKNICLNCCVELI